jgi:hypothetical protein
MQSNGTLRVFVFHSSGFGRIGESEGWRGEEREERIADSELNSTYFSPGNTKLHLFSTKHVEVSMGSRCYQYHY